jgi:hypothetical protein
MTGDELRYSWQGRMLHNTRNRPVGAVVCSIIANSDDEPMELLLRAVFPDYAGLKPPGLCSAGRIARNGTVVADIITIEGIRLLRQAIFLDTEQLQNTFRHICDDMKLSDADRKEVFDYVRRWIVADFRLDPRMDPNDPDARRYVTH